jgi:hypothetical protein
MESVAFYLGTGQHGAVPFNGAFLPSHSTLQDIPLPKNIAKPMVPQLLAVFFPADSQLEAGAMV